MNEEPQSDKRINIREVDRSNIIISDRDVIINAPLTTPKVEEQTRSDTSTDQPAYERTKPRIGIITALEIEYVAVEILLENLVAGY